jgi:hypothetical protein
VVGTGNHTAGHGVYTRRTRARFSVSIIPQCFSKSTLSGRS